MCFRGNFSFNLFLFMDVFISQIPFRRILLKIALEEETWISSFAFTEMLYVLDKRLFLCSVDELYSLTEQRILFMTGPFRFSYSY